MSTLGAYGDLDYFSDFQTLKIQKLKYVNVQIVDVYIAQKKVFHLKIIYAFLAIMKNDIISK